MVTGRRVESPLAGAAAALLLGLALVSTAAGCRSGDAIVFPKNETPFLYLVLNQTVAPAGEPVQPAFLLTLVSADSTAFRTAERFEMRRASGGSTFGWREGGLFGATVFDQGSAPRLEEANYLLGDSVASGELGLRDLEPGGSYELVIETGGATIRGSVTVPDSFSISLVERGDEVRAVWPAVDGAAGYSITVRGDEIFEPVFQTDTTFRLRPGSRSITVRAADPHAFRYLTDEDARRAGIRGASGVFGAIQTAELE